MSRARPSSLEYGKSDVSGADTRGAGGGGGFKSPEAARASMARVQSESAQPVREFTGKSLRKIIEDTSQVGKSTDEMAQQRDYYLKGKGGLHYAKGGKVRYASGGFVDDFASGFNQSFDPSKTKKKRKDDEDLFPDVPKENGVGLYRRGGKVPSLGSADSPPSPRINKSGGKHQATTIKPKE